MNITALYTLFLSSSGVTTDTRNIQGGELFIALKGDRFNGNQFVGQALEAGCQAALTCHPETAAQHQNAFLVEDGLSALQNLAREHRKHISATVIGLTGSNGKTTSKELLRDVLATTYRTYATRGNLNNHIGVPLSMLEILPEHEYAVIEMGANAQGEIAMLCEICQPDFGFITNIGKAHLEGFGGIEGVKKGKGELFRYLRANSGKAFVNAADPILLQLSQGLERILYGTDIDSPEVYLVNSSPTLSIGWSHHHYFVPRIETHLVGEYNLENLATAIAIGRYFNVEPEAINTALSAYRPDNNRSELRKTDRNTVIMDAYNANPTSMEHALRSFAECAGDAKLCILGDMLELGDEAPREHLAIVALVRHLGLPTFFIGPLFAAANDQKGPFYRTVDEIQHQLSNASVSGTDILLKGSRGMQLERLLPLL